jgi:addiction module RelE/StbE family toxin
MFRILYKASFVRSYDKLEPELKAEVKEKIELLKSRTNHQALKVHKLQGELKSYYSFSVNYKYRIVFSFINKEEIALLGIGDHDVYR